MKNRSAQILGKLIIVLLFLVAVLSVLVIVLLRSMRGPESTATTTNPSAASRHDAATTPISGAGTTLDTIRRRGELLVAMDTGEPAWTGTPPMYFPSETGEPDGFDYLIARKVAEAVGVSSVRIIHAKYSDLLARLTDGMVDAVISGYVPDDTEGVAFSIPYLEFGLCMIVPANSKIRNTADLWGKPIGIFDDDAAETAVRNLIRGFTEIIRLQDGYWDQLLSGRFAAFIYDYPYAVAEINSFYKQNPHRKGSLRIAQYNLNESTYAVAVRAADTDLLAAANSAIQAFRATPEYGAAIKKYLSGGISVDDVADAGKRVYIVQAGDTLSTIARKELGSTEKWKDLWAINRSRFPNPHLIEVGDKVLLP